MTALDINRQFVGLVNDNVDKLNAARNAFPSAYVETVLLPQHEEALQSLIAWKTSQLRKVAGFSAAKQPAVPKNVVDAFNKAYKAQAAEIIATYNSTVAAANKTYKDTIASIKSQLAQITSDTNAKLKVAHQLKDTQSVNALNGALNQAKAAAKTSNTNAKSVLDQTLAQAKSDQSTALRTLSDRLTALFNGSSVYSPPGGPPVSATSGGPVPNGTTTYVYNAATNTYIPTSNVIAPPGQGQSVSYVQSSGSGSLVAAPDGTSYQPIVGAPDVYNTNAGVTSGSWLNDLFNAILSGFEHLLTPQNYTAATPSPTAVVAPVSPSTPVYSPGSTFTPTDNQLDVFQTSGWGAYAGRNPFFGNTVVQEFNSRRSMPSVAFGFSQWATIASSIIQAGASIGAAAATSALAPRSSAPSNNNAAVQAALLQQQLAQQQASKSNMTPWLIGGGVAVLALVLVVATKKK